MLRGVIVGKNINYSQSPNLYNSYFQKNSIDATYKILNVESENYFKDILKNSKYDFFNITQPYKNIAFRYIDKLDSIATKTQNINLIIKKNDKLLGYNSDYFGFSTYKKSLNKNTNSILLVGRGGVAQTVYTYLKDNHKDIKLYIISPRDNKISSFFKEYENFHPKRVDAPILCYRFDLMIFAASHLAEGIIVDYNLYPKNIINLNYQSRELENYAILNKIPYINGYSMLLKQFDKNIEILNSFFYSRVSL